jgi:DNA replication initiation complex subunit (GINS family)
MNLVGDEIELVEKFFEKLNDYFEDLKDQIKKIEETRKTEKNFNEKNSKINRIGQRGRIKEQIFIKIIQIGILSTLTTSNCDCFRI